MILSLLDLSNAAKNLQKQTSLDHVSCIMRNCIKSYSWISLQISTKSNHLKLRFGRNSDILGGPLRCYTRPWHCLVWTQHKRDLWSETSTQAWQRRMAHQLKSSGGKWGLGFKCLFHPLTLKCPDVHQVAYSLARSASKQWGSHDGMVFFEGSLLASCDATPGLGTAWYGRNIKEIYDLKLLPKHGNDGWRTN